MTAPRAHFTETLAALEHDIQSLANEVDGRVNQALRVLLDRDAALAEQVIQNDREINARRLELEHTCITMMAEQAPVATDLRLAVSILFTATELERVGDYAVAIARIGASIPGNGALPLLPDVMAMAERSRTMLREAVAALLERDEAAARSVGSADTAVDEAQNTIFRQMVEQAEADPAQFEARTQILWIVHNLERLADRATNIAERAIYIATGEIAELN